MKKETWCGIPVGECEHLLKELAHFAKYRYLDFEPEDLAMDTLIRGVPKLSPVDPKKRLAFLKTTMHRLVLSQLRLKRPTLVTLVIDPLDRQDGSEAIRAEWLSRLRDEVRRLRPRLRIVVDLTNNGLSRLEIASQLAIAESTVRSRYAIALKTLKDRLSE